MGEEPARPRQPRGLPLEGNTSSLGRATVRAASSQDDCAGLWGSVDRDVPKGGNWIGCQETLKSACPYKLEMKLSKVSTHTCTLAHAHTYGQPHAAANPHSARSHSVCEGTPGV